MTNKNHNSETVKELSESKFGDSDSEIDIPPGGCADDRHVVYIFCEGSLSADARGETCVRYFLRQNRHT